MATTSGLQGVDVDPTRSIQVIWSTERRATDLGRGATSLVPRSSDPTCLARLVTSVVRLRFYGCGPSGPAAVQGREGGESLGEQQPV